jgi:hypothetical protein
MNASTKLVDPCDECEELCYHGKRLKDDKCCGYCHYKARLEGKESDCDHCLMNLLMQHPVSCSIPVKHPKKKHSAVNFVHHRSCEEENAKERDYYHSQQAKGLCTRKGCNRPLSAESKYLCNIHLRMARESARGNMTEGQKRVDYSKVIGVKTNMLTVIGVCDMGREANGRKRHMKLICRCECEKEIVRSANWVLSGNAYSCGCKRREREH